MALDVTVRMDVTIRESGSDIYTYDIVDVTTYGGVEVDAADVYGLLTIKSPTGSILYINEDIENPDITTGNLSKDNLSCPLDADGNMTSGDYEIKLDLYLKSDDSSAGTGTTTITFNYVAPTVSIEQIPDGYASTFKSTDLTDYGTYTPTRTHEITVPIGSSMVDVSNSNASNTINANIWSGVYTTTITTDLVYASTNLIVYDEVIGEESITVYKVDRNTVYNAVEAFNDTYNDYIGSNPTVAKTLQNTSIQVSAYQVEYDNSVEKGDTRRAYNSLVKISELLSPDFIDELFTVTEEITPFTIVYDVLWHQHANLSVLALLGDSGGVLQYDGNPVVDANAGKVLMDDTDSLDYLETKVDDTTIGVSAKKLIIKSTYPSTIIDDDWIELDGNSKLTLNETKLSSTIGAVTTHTIKLKANSTLAGRIADGDSEFPTDWTPSVQNTNDLVLTHSLWTKNLAFVNVWYLDSGTYYLITNSSGYTGASSSSTVDTITSVATASQLQAYDIKIDLIYN